MPGDSASPVHRNGLEPRPRTILYVISDLQVGGTEQQVVALAIAMAKRRWDVTVYSFSDGEFLRQKLEQNGVRVLVTPGNAGRPRKSASLVAGSTLRLFKLLMSERPSVAHFFLPAAYLVGAPLSVLARVRVRVMSRRSLNTYQRSSAVRLLEKVLHRQMHAVLGNSRKVVEQLSDEGVASERLGLIYNGVDHSSFAVGRANARTELQLDAAPLVLCIVANLIPYKGHRDLFEALALAAPEMPTGWRLLVVGRDDGIRAELKEQVRRAGLETNILFLGQRPDVPAVLAASDIGVLCSHEEGFSNAILEGMAAGLPMIVTEVGGNAEAVADGVTGLLVPSRDIPSLAKAIVRLSNDADLRRRLGAAARHRVIEQFSREPMLEAHLRLYEGLLAGKAPRDVERVGLAR